MRSTLGMQISSAHELPDFKIYVILYVQKSYLVLNLIFLSGKRLGMQLYSGYELPVSKNYVILYVLRGYFGFTTIIIKFKVRADNSI